MSERFGVAVAVVSSSFGAGAAVATRYLIGAADPFTLAAIRFGGGVLCLLPLVAMLPVRWPPRQDWPVVAGLGLLFYAVFFVLYNVALGFTTVARGTLALSTLPLMTMVAGAVLGIEALTARKTAGVLVAMLGVGMALASGLAHAPTGAWRGDLIMAAEKVTPEAIAFMAKHARGLICLPLSAGMALFVIAATISGRWKNFGLWLAVALAGHAVSLQGINAGHHIHYQHYTFAHSWWLLLTALQAVAVAPSGSLLARICT
jgi:drug/metabolite transporter (DMT)-like permease